MGSPEDFDGLLALVSAKKIIPVPSVTVLRENSTWAIAAAALAMKADSKKTRLPTIALPASWKKISSMPTAAGPRPPNISKPLAKAHTL